MLLVKLQRTQAEPDDLRDMLGVLESAAALGDQTTAPAILNLDYLARLCAADWGLCHDVERNLARCRDALATPARRDPGVQRAPARLDALDSGPGGSAAELALAAARRRSANGSPGTSRSTTSRASTFAPASGPDDRSTARVGSGPGTDAAFALVATRPRCDDTVATSSARPPSHE